ATSSCYPLYRTPPPQDLPPFPTRRSSDLWAWSAARAILYRPALVAAVIERPLACLGSPRAGLPADRARHLASRLRSELTIKAERSEEHTSELQSRFDLVCRLLLEKKNSKR